MQQVDQCGSGDSVVDFGGMVGGGDGGRGDGGDVDGAFNDRGQVRALALVNQSLFAHFLPFKILTNGSQTSGGGGGSGGGKSGVDD